MEKHIAEKCHLINIPSAKEVVANGIEVGETNRLLLEKIEEFTLILLRQNMDVKALQVELQKIQKKERNTKK